MQPIANHIRENSTKPRNSDRAHLNPERIAQAKTRRRGSDSLVSGCIRSLRVTCVAWCLLLMTATNAVAQTPSVIMADRIVARDGQLILGQAVAIHQGKIAAVNAAKNYVGKPGVVRYPGAVICPGLIDVVSSIGAVDQTVERAYAVDPEATVVDAVDTQHRDFQTALHAGITAALITPSRNNLISGAAAVISTAVEPGGPTWLRTDGPLIFSLGSAVLASDRAPTSRLGALAMLRDVLLRAGEVPGHRRVASFVRGELDGLVFCEKAMDVSAALRTLGSFGSHIGFVHTSHVGEISSELSAKRHTLIVGPYNFTTSTATMAAAVAVSKTGVPVVFAGRLPFAPSESLRISAALACRHGMEPAVARRAITSAAAAVAGVGNRVGAIEPGLRADLVVFSDDPLRLNARVLAVYVAGKLVYKAAKGGRD